MSIFPSLDFFLKNKNPKDYSFVFTLLSFFVKPTMLGSVGQQLQLVFFIGSKTIGGRLCCSYRNGGGNHST
jgi:hypothetical protein